MDASFVVTLCMTQTLELAAGVWCIGQVASAPCVHVHSAKVAPEDPIQSAVGTIANVAVWPISQATAMAPRTRRRRVMGRYVSAAHKRCQLRRIQMR